MTSADALPAGTMQVLEGDTVLAQSEVPAGQTTTPVGLPRLSVGSHMVAARFAPADGSTPSRTPDVALTVHAGCLWAPVHCGLPGYRNTGVPTGTPLRAIEHSVVIRRAGTVFQNAVVHGNVEVLADDVTVRNVRILVGGNTWGIGLRHADRTTIDRVEVRGGRTRLEVGIKDVYDDGVGTRITRSEITRTATGIQLGSATISGNFIHRMALVAGDHVNGITSNGSTRPLVVRRNTIVNQIPQTDAIGLFQDFGLEANRTVADNLLAGGGYTVYAGGRGRYGTSHDIRITGNRFSRAVFARGGRWGIRAYYDTGGRNNTWSGNVWDAYGHPAYR